MTAPAPVSTADLLKGTSREFILLAGKDGGGKSSAIVALAKWVQDVLNPAATFYVIDTENKFPTALRSFAPDAPTNIAYFKTETMNDVNAVWDIINEKRKPYDWLAVESMARIWERAQDMGYQAVSGFTKAAYLEKRRTVAKAAVVIPRPDDFWNIVKGAHDSAFLDQISQAVTLNCILTTTISKPPKEGGFIKENATRKEARIEFGLDAGMDGAPRLPTYVETTAILDIRDGKVSCRVVRDDLSKAEVTRKEFDVENKRLWAQNFYFQCRG